MVTPSSAEPSSETVGVEPENLECFVSKISSTDGNFLTCLALDLFGVASVRETFTCRSMSLKMGTDPAELLGGHYFDHVDIGKELT
jgi:hypothetical protein